MEKPSGPLLAVLDRPALLQRKETREGGCDAGCKQTPMTQSQIYPSGEQMACSRKPGIA
jgi:hypothetical protein